jgi:hypothetical protein
VFAFAGILTGGDTRNPNLSLTKAVRCRLRHARTSWSWSGESNSGNRVTNAALYQLSYTSSKSVIP